ncbi:IclR family transcriptional regulator C-terminal domain-containing protein [Kitasatospora sp. NPDC093806]|uniref:IclR family transcriptional regulator domain-containing protein n=1 Tax=Kitasatospora sp. NPDC093806 TaxID=3155075 RepID=UPI00341DB621
MLDGWCFALPTSEPLTTGPRVFLAYLDKVELCGGGFPGVIRDNDELAATLDEIRRLGFAVGRQECMLGWDSVAAPVLWHDAIMGAALMLKPSTDMPADLRPLIYHTRKAAESISALTTSPPATGG